jgi:DNA-binding transcriptional LysR family regulator
MELDWLETFLAVADTGGFTAAGEQVHRSQSRVSAHIAALERDIGVRLIDRTRRPARLTTAGKVFARRARDIVAAVGAARSAVGPFRGLDEGRIALHTAPCLGATVFPRVVADLAAEYPGLRVELVERTDQDLQRWFLAEGIAMAVIPAQRDSSATGLREQVLWRARFVAIVPVDHELAGVGGPVGLAELVRHALVLCGPSAGGEPEVLRMLAELGVAVAPRATTDSLQMLVALVRAGVGVGVVSSVAVADLDVTGLAVLDVDEPALANDVAAYWVEALPQTRLGRRLHHAVTRAPVPEGALPADRASPGAEQVPPRGPGGGSTEQ